MSSKQLSEKAKGKRRAVDASDEAEDTAPQLATKTLVIRFSEGIPDLTLQVAEQDAVRDVKQKVSDGC